MLGKEYQTHDVPTLEIAFHNIANWYDHYRPLPYVLSLDYGPCQMKVGSNAWYNS
jgi:hypothetical protein